MKFEYVFLIQWWFWETYLSSVLPFLETLGSWFNLEAVPMRWFKAGSCSVLKEALKNDP